METIVATLKQEAAVLVLNCNSASNEEIAEFVGSSKFYADSSGRYVTYAQKGIGLISRLQNGDHIIKRGDKIIEILDRHSLKQKYQIYHE